MKQIVLKVLFVLFGMFIGMEAFAQFYDDDKVYFYITNRFDAPEVSVEIIIFDGNYLGTFLSSYQQVRISLKSDINYYEKRFSEFHYDYIYDSNKSDESTTAYSASSSGRIGTYYVSKDRKHFLLKGVYIGGKTEIKGTLVDKSYFLKGSKYNVENNEGTIYE